MGASVHAYEFPCLSTCVCVISMPQCMRMNFHVSVHAYVFPCLSACVCISMSQHMLMFFHASVHAYAISRSQCLRTLILVFVCCKTRLVTFVLRGCDSISLVPYVPGPILATICRSESQLTRVQLHMLTIADCGFII